MNNTYNYFNLSSITSLEDLKKAYRKLAKQYHPDLNKEDTTKDMQAINSEYELLFTELKHTNKSQANNNNSETSSSFIKIINELIKYDNITIDIVGTWLWIEGNTYPIKEVLKELGFRYQKKSKKWYLGEFDASKKRKKSLSWNEKVMKYGQETIKSNKKPILHLT